MTEIVWHLEMVKIKDLKPHPRNPRYISKDQFQHLTKMIEKFGLIDRPILNLDLTIIGGHQRVKVLKKLKTKEVECWIPNRELSDEEINHLCVGLNLNQGEFDFDVLANEFDPLELMNWGFSEKDLLGAFSDEVEDDKKKSDKKKKECPNCGHIL